MDNDVLTRNENGELSVRTVGATERASVVNPNDVYTRTTEGYLAVRTVGGSGGGGGGGSDPHNLGWYATQSALESAHPTAVNGDWAIVGSTDTVWVWDSDTNTWKDTDQKGQVESVNGKTGTVVLTPSDIGAATAAQGVKADTAIQSVKTINNQSIVGEGNIDINVATTPLTMPELTVAGWSSNTQTVTVTGVTATNTVFVSPAPESAADYAAAGIVCTAQAVDSLTFTCTTVPTNAITVNVVIF